MLRNIILVILVTVLLLAVVQCLTVQPPDDRFDKQGKGRSVVAERPPISATPGLCLKGFTWRWPCWGVWQSALCGALFRVT